MKILLDMGHCLSGADTGAIGNGRKEQDCTREIGGKVKLKLESLGHTVIICSCDSANSLVESLAYRVNKAKTNGGDLYVSIHLNAGGGFGVEIFTYGTNSFIEATRTLESFVALGFKNRGIKNGSGLYVIKNTPMKSMLIECCFIDTTDMQKYNAEDFSNAIVKGITGQLPIVKPIVPDINFKIDIFGHIQDVGNMIASGINDCTIGTVGQSKRIEALSINIDGVDLEYTTHVQDVGNINGVLEGQVEGTIGQGKRLEAITITVKSIPSGYKLQYQAHVENTGWQEWKESGQLAGTQGESLRMEALRIKIVKI